MTKTIELLDSYEWLGEFWFPGCEGEKFPGKLSYSPSDGLLLNAMRHCDTAPLEDEEVPIVYGLTFETGRITLLSLARRTGTVRPSLARQDEFYCGSAVLGEHVSREAKFRSCQFQLNNLNEFFHRQGFKLDDRFTSDPVLSGGGAILKEGADGSGFDVEISKTAAGAFLGSSASRVFLLDEAQDQELIQALDDALSSVRSQFDRPLLIKSEIGYKVTVGCLGPNGASVAEFKAIATEICGFFSLLFLKFVRPTVISLSPDPERDATKGIQEYPLVLSLYLSRNQIKQMSNDKGRFYLPMTSDCLLEGFGDIMRSWFEYIGTGFNIVYPTLQAHRSGAWNPLQHFILLVAAMDQCCDGRKEDRYQWLIERYGNEKVLSRFLDNLPAKSAESGIGKDLAEIRNCIVHPVKLRSSGARYQEVLTSARLSNLSELIQIILVNFVYEKLGLPQFEIDRFQSCMDTHIAAYEDAS